MEAEYHNFHTTIALDGWQQRTFVRDWQRLKARDPFWSPPFYPHLMYHAQTGNNPHLARLNPTYISATALRRRRTANRVDFHPADPTAGFDQTVVTGLALRDERHRLKYGYLAALALRNHPRPLQVMLDKVYDALAPRGMRAVLAPTGLSMYLGTGMQLDGWNVHVPPQMASYPPYLPEMLAHEMMPFAEARAYAVDVNPSSPQPTGPAVLAPLDPLRLAKDLFPLWQALLPGRHGIPAPDLDETHFLLEWLNAWPLTGILAVLDRVPVGFVLLQPDDSPRMRQFGGGRRLISRLALAATRRFDTNVRAGHIVFGGVHPDYRGQGVGTQLWHAANRVAQQAGWQRLSCGPQFAAPVSDEILQHWGMRPTHTAAVYRLAFS